MPVSKIDAEQLFNFYRQKLENTPIFIGNIYYKLTPGWTLGFDRFKKSSGRCHGHHKKLITLSTQYLKSNVVTLYDVSETILHELAHAIAGNHNGHNAIWKYIAMLIGSTGSEYCNKMFAPYKYTLTCPKGCEYYRYQLSKKAYTERERGIATCPKHKNLPVLVVKNDDNTMVRSYATESDFEMIINCFFENTTGVKPTDN